MWVSLTAFCELSPTASWIYCSGFMVRQIFMAAVNAAQLTVAKKREGEGTRHIFLENSPTDLLPSTSSDILLLPASNNAIIYEYINMSYLHVSEINPLIRLSPQAPTTSPKTISWYKRPQHFGGHSIFKPNSRQPLKAGKWEETNIAYPCLVPIV